MWTNVAATAGVERVRVSRLSDDGKLPFILQLRAEEAFKKGSLVLTPAYGELLPHDADVAHHLETARSQGVLHAAMLSHVEVKVVAAGGDRRRSEERAQPRVSPFVMCSPLLAGKAAKNRADCMKNLAPFWALLQRPGPRASQNMELDVIVFRDPGFDATRIRVYMFPRESPSQPGFL